ncbi:MAG: 3-deoxy-7-phosphoheptulonate synthase [Planctomycetes bacterium]|nr:3-deoxy-7-phosphoheptulonate synthase [Planctomycetota bacterium]
MKATQDLHVRGLTPLISPRDLKNEQPMTEEANETIVRTREVVKRILQGEDPRLMVVVGPCSIHDEQAALEYAQRLRRLAKQVEDQLLVLMRVYFEKPRTTLGWKGLINDPRLDDSFAVSEGLRIARRLLLTIAEMDLPTATEMLEPITPQYIADLVTWAAIGARTTESPTHRQMASGLSMPVGFKNGTDGEIATAVDALVASRSPHNFLGINPDGQTCLVHTTGNPFGHLILRGGRGGPNYAPEHVAQAAAMLSERGLSPRFMIDCSHANSNKDYRRQAEVWNSVLQQRLSGSEAIIGMMLESNLHAGAQKLGDPAKLEYGVSITDGCIGWDETEELLLAGREKLAEAATAV